MDGFKKCQCGLGENWYCRGESYTTHEFNRGPNPTARYHADRKPEAAMFGHISGKYAVARVSGSPDKIFKYTKDLDYSQAKAAAVQYIVDELTGNQVKEVQMDLLAEAQSC